jgi:hypothetical protein
MGASGEALRGHGAHEGRRPREAVKRLAPVHALPEARLRSLWRGHDARSRGGDAYLCHGRLKFGPESCPQLPIPRATLDTAVFRYFESAALDMEAMRAELREATAAKSRDVAELRRQAERDEQQAAERVARVRRDYTAGAMTADEWRELSADSKAEHEAAKSKLAQLEARAAEVEQAEQGESEAAVRLAEIRAAIAGEVQSADGLNAARAALARMFESFTVARAMERDETELPPHVAALVAEQDAEIARVLAADGVARSMPTSGSSCRGPAPKSSRA